MPRPDSAWNHRWQCRVEHRQDVSMAETSAISQCACYRHSMIVLSYRTMKRNSLQPYCHSNAAISAGHPFRHSGPPQTPVAHAFLGPYAAGHRRSLCATERPPNGGRFGGGRPESAARTAAAHTQAGHRGALGVHSSRHHDSPSGEVRCVVARTQSPDQRKRRDQDNWLQSVLIAERGPLSYVIHPLVVHSGHIRP
jgi:hypothetical protein